MLRRSLILLVAACGSRQPPPPVAEPAVPEPAASASAPEPSPPPPDPEPRPPDPLAEPEPPPFTIPIEKPAPVGKVTRLDGRKKTSLSHGLHVTYADQRHKHRVDGGATGFYDLVFERGGRKLDVTLTADDLLEAELDALGILVVVTGLQTSLALDITVVGKTPAPLDEDAAYALIEERAKAHGLPIAGAGYGSADGVFWYASTPSHGGDERWRGHVGLYTRRVWFRPPMPPER